MTHATPGSVRSRGRVATVVLLGLVGAFAVQLSGPGVAERVAAGALAIWPLAVVGSARRHRWRNGSIGRQR